MLTTNLYGSIVSNVICGLIGGAGLYSGKNYGDHYAVFEPGKSAELYILFASLFDIKKQ